MFGAVAEAVASRAGAPLVCTGIAVACISAGVFFDRGAATIADTQTKLVLHQESKGHAAFNELMHASLIVEAASLEGSADESFRRELSQALDFLHVRAEHLSRLADRETEQKLGDFRVQRELRAGRAQAIADIRELIARIDDAFADDFTDLDQLTADVARLTDDTRLSLFSYLEELERAENGLVATQSDILVGLSRSMKLFLGVIMAAGFVSVLLLRREVATRRMHKMAEERASFLAYFDTLTGLANRINLRDAVGKRLEESGTPLTLMMIDVDRFKLVNDRLGTKEGDAVLCEIGRRLGEVAEAHGALAARLGADQFALSMDTEKSTLVRSAAQDILRLTASPITTSDGPVQVSLSVGVASRRQLTQDEASSAGALFGVTEFALSRAKRDGGNRISEYDISLKQELVRRREMMEELPAAISHGRLHVYLQPKVVMDTGTVVGFEALVRWKRDGKIVPPGEFIAIAEECGLIIDLDNYMLDRAVQIVADWNSANGTDFGVSVNVSALHLFKSDLAAYVPAVLSRWQLPPGLLTIEITESVELNDWSRVGGALYALKHCGCRISIDDFGTGYSSLAYLRAIPADELKIDKSLVDEIETVDEAKFILDAVLDLASSLNLDVVVEGIERPSQVTTLMSFGCAYGQGYFFGRPLPAEESLAAAMPQDANALAFNN